ncbi:hypothetical protein AaE_001642, partial [Aphanomyces astaci]
MPSTLEEQLAKLRAGNAPSPPSRVQFSPASFLSIPHHDEICEDDWDDDEDVINPTPITQESTIPVAPPPCVINPPPTIHPTSQSNVPRAQRNDIVYQQQLYQRAIDITKSAMAKERGRDYAAAVDAYVDAGDIFTEIGRNELDPATQRTLKKKAFSLLQRAEALADWLDSHAAPSISEATNVAAMASAEAETEVQATEKHIEDMKQELKQLKYTSQIMKADDASDLGEATKA